MNFDVERFYPFEEITNNGSCIRYIRDLLGHEVRDDRCKATWRGGDDWTVALTERGWFDHKTKEKGSLIKLCAMIEFGGNIQQAQQRLGDWLGLTPATRTIRKTFDYRTQSLRYKELVQRGYSEVEKYTYTDENGTPIHFVVRMEHPTEKKQFIQCTPYSGSIKDVETQLYNLPVIVQSSWVVVVEGEKDANTLISWGIPATTCNNGSDFWKQEYTEKLSGKDVIVCRDNDEPGNEHAHLVMRSIANVAKSIRVICPSHRAKGDVTDWAKEENGTLKRFMSLIENAPIITAEEAMWSDEELSVYRAKKANKTEFSNYRMIERIVDGKPKTVKIPRTVLEMIEEVHTRFIGFPRRLGLSTLFDHDRTTDKIEFLHNGPSLFAWICEKSKKAVMWDRGVGFVTKDEFFQALIRNSTCYEKISDVPNFPMRTDVYYTFKDKMKATFNHDAFNKFMSFFHPENRQSEVLMRSLAASMMYYRVGIQRPCWIIDSKNGQSAGKTTFAEMLCYLYKCSPIKTSKQELEYDSKEVNKRLVSTTGRNSLMLLVDNVRGTFDNAYFADLVTCFNVSGKAPYGIGEESRPNDLTYVITSNSANIGSDIASRSFILFIKSPTERNNKWKQSVFKFIDDHRYEILGDIYEILTTGEVPENFVAATRVPEFESDVVYKMAGSESEYKKTIEELMASRDEANTDEENAIQVVEILKARLREILELAVKTERLRSLLGTISSQDTNPDKWAVFVRSPVIKMWLRKMMVNVDVQDIRNMVNVGSITCIDKKIRRYPESSRSKYRMSGLMFYGDSVEAHNSMIPIIGLKDKDSTEVVTYVEDASTIFNAINRHISAESIPSEKESAVSEEEEMESF